jgi:hypothetical protein
MLATASVTGPVRPAGMYSGGGVRYWIQYKRWDTRRPLADYGVHVDQRAGSVQLVGLILARPVLGGQALWPVPRVPDLR